MTFRTRIAVLVVLGVALLVGGIVCGVVWGMWRVSVLEFAESVGALIIAARLVRVGYYARSNVATGILVAAFGVGLIGLGLTEANTIGYLFAVAGVIELGAGIHYVRKPDVPAHI